MKNGKLQVESLMKVDKVKVTHAIHALFIRI